MSNVCLNELGTNVIRKQNVVRPRKVACIYGQRKAYLTVKRFQIVEDGEIKTKYYRKLSFSY